MLARADEPGSVAPANGPALSTLLARSARHAQDFEEMKKRASFTMRGRLEELDGDGKVAVTKEMSLRSTATPTARVNEILRYAEDGADKTAEYRREAEAKRRARTKDKKKDWHLPFLAAEQPRYTFAVSGRDATREHTKITFQPLAAAEDTFRGSAWIDEHTGEILTLAFTPSKLPLFVDRLDVDVRFDLRTPLGRAPSTISVDVRGGLLVVHKRYRGAATITDPAVAF